MWYLNVRDETMAPARMVSFIEQHVASCSVCRQDPDIHDEVAKITEIVLPESKIPKAVRSEQTDDDTDDEEFNDEDTDNSDDEDLDDESLDEGEGEDLEDNEDEPQDEEDT